MTCVYNLLPCSSEGQLEIIYFRDIQNIMRQGAAMQLPVRLQWNFPRQYSVRAPPSVQPDRCTDLTHIGDGRGSLHRFTGISAIVRKQFKQIVCICVYIYYTINIIYTIYQVDTTHITVVRYKLHIYIRIIFSSVYIYTLFVYMYIYTHNIYIISYYIINILYSIILFYVIQLTETQHWTDHTCMFALITMACSQNACYIIFIYIIYVYSFFTLVQARRHGPKSSHQQKRRLRTVAPSVQLNWRSTI